jgi:hypothetical protein
VTLLINASESNTMASHITGSNEAITVNLLGSFRVDGEKSPSEMVSNHWENSQMQHKLPQTVFYSGDTHDLNIENTNKNMKFGL